MPEPPKLLTESDVDVAAFGLAGGDFFEVRERVKLVCFEGVENFVGQAFCSADLPTSPNACSGDLNLAFTESSDVSAETSR